jgi:hypothetical protein
MKKSLDKKLRGSVGEFLVCGVLGQYEWAAGLTRDGIAMTDVLAQHAQTGEAVSVQVKTTWVDEGREAKWQVGLKDIRPATSDSQWYVMVKLEGAAPAASTFFVVPKDHVAAAVWIVHQRWLTDPSVPPGQRNTPVSRAIINERFFARYEGRWDLLGTPSSKAPVLLPSDLRQSAQLDRVGLPPDHPWLNGLPKW